MSFYFNIPENEGQDERGFKLLNPDGHSGLLPLIPFQKQKLEDLKLDCMSKEQRKPKTLS